MSAHQALFVGGESAVDPDFASVLMLMHGAIADSSSYARSLNTNISTGSAGALAPGAINSTVLNGNAHATPYVVTASNQTGSEFNSKNWTFETRYYRTTAGSYVGLMYQRQNLGVIVVANNDASPADLHKVRIIKSGSVWLTGTTQIPLNTWTSIAVSVSEAAGTYTGRIFVNGVMEASGTTGDANAGLLVASEQLDLGRHDQAGFRGIGGVIEEWRLSKVCRYTGNYTPRTTRFPDSA